MRIVIDMQGAQADNRQCGIGRYTFSLAQAIARNRGKHELFLALNGLFPETIPFIRAAFDDLLPQENIRVWYAQGPVRACEIDNSWRNEVAERIREGFLASLQPDIVYISSMDDGYDNDTVMSIGVFAAHLLTVVALHDSLMNQNPDDLYAIRFHLRKKEYLKRAQFYHLISPLSAADSVRHLNVCADDLLESKVSIATSATEKEFDAEAHQLLKQFETLVENNNLVTVSANVMSHKRPRLAYVSPLPPERTGIADYSAELLPELARYYDIDVIVVQEQISDQWILANCAIRSVDWFRANAYVFDRVLYHFGNSHFHQHMCSLLEEIPGVVVLHDFFLSAMVAHRDVSGLDLGSWSTELYHAHGYAAVQKRFHVKDLGDVVWEYPCNLSILQYAQGVIIHAEASRRLARQWYREKFSDDWDVIPLLRVSADDFDCKQSRKMLKLNDEDFVVCSFGMLGISKLNHRLLDCWLASEFVNDKNCILVFVGENAPGEYGQQLLDKIDKSDARKRIRITGWTDSSTFRDYLAVADVAVQLRTLSRGETSAAVLDCMNYSIPTIVNANGSMADLPGDALWMLPDEFTHTELVDALKTLWKDSELRIKLAGRAKEVILTQHDPAACAHLYFQEIEAMYTRSATDYHAVIKAIAALDKFSPDTRVLESIANSIAATFPQKASQHQLLIDVSSIAINDLKSGIERVVRAQLLALIKEPLKAYRVEPVYLSNQGGQWHYRYARLYTCKMLGIKSLNLVDEPIDICSGDVFYGLDFNPNGIIEANNSGLFLKWKAAGVSINFLVYDLLPILRPEFFPEGAATVHAAWLKTIVQFATQLICISNAVADELRVWLAANVPPNNNQLLINAVHLGADILTSVPSLGLPKNAEKVLKAIKSIPTFIMVGTIEPRKGYLQTLAAFELLWQQGYQVNLVIVGNEGWKPLPNHERRTIPVLVEKLRKHPELNKRLFWLEGISDEYLEKTYAASTCLILASEGEGFGLPLIEAAQHKLPIIARNIPVFFEVADVHAYYFEGLEAEALSQAIQAWLLLYAQGTSPDSSDMSWLTWEQSAQQLLQKIFPSL